MAETQGEKLQEVEIQTLKTQWPMCKADGLIDKLAERLEKKTLEVLGT